MKKALLITNSNVDISAGNTTLLFRRAESMFRCANVFTEIIVYPSDKYDYENRACEFCSITYVSKKAILFERIKKMEPDFIIFYGDRIELLIPSIKKLCKNSNINSQLLLDVQGAVEEIKEYPSSLRRKFLYPVYKHLFKRSLKIVDGAFVVSDELIENCESKINRAKNRPTYYKIRCGISQLLSIEQYKLFRNQFRNKHSIDDKIVFCFSGYRYGWQKIDETIRQFKQYDSLLENAYFCFFCNSDDAFEKQLEKEFPKHNYYVTLLKQDEYFQALCGCDVGFLIRDMNETNRVAFPNKFSDYCNAGLLIAIDESLAEPFRLLKNYKIRCLATKPNELSNNIQLINDRNRNIESFFYATNKMCANELTYDKQIRDLFKLFQ